MVPDANPRCRHGTHATELVEKWPGVFALGKPGHHVVGVVADVQVDIAGNRSAETVVVRPKAS